VKSVVNKTKLKALSSLLPIVKAAGYEVGFDVAGPEEAGAVGQSGSRASRLATHWI